MKNPTVNQIAALFNVPGENVKNQFAKNARQLRELAKQASFKICRGKTSAEWLKLAMMAESKAK